MLETKAINRAYLERKKKAFFFFCLSSMPNPALGWGTGARINLPQPFSPLSTLTFSSVPTQGASPKPAYVTSLVTSLFPTSRNHSRGPCLLFPLAPSASLPTLVPRRVALRHVTCSFMVGTVSN